MKNNELYVRQFDLMDGKGKSHVVTIVGIYSLENKLNDIIIYKDEGIFITNSITKIKTLSIGHAIQNPSDEYNKEIGINLATKRALSKKYRLGYIQTEDLRMLSDSMNMAIIENQVEFIYNNKNKFIPFEK